MKFSKSDLGISFWRVDACACVYREFFSTCVRLYVSISLNMSQILLYTFNKSKFKCIQVIVKEVLRGHHLNFIMLSLSGFFSQVSTIWERIKSLLLVSTIISAWKSFLWFLRTSVEKSESKLQFKVFSPGMIDFYFTKWLKDLMTFCRNSFEIV